MLSLPVMENGGVCSWQSLVVLLHHRRDLSAVDLHVFLEVARLTEAPATGGADVGSLPRMEPPVDDHLVPGGEGLSTELTAVGPGVGVNPLVFPEKVSPLEVLGAVGALEGPLVGVNTADVEEELSLASMTRTTDITDIRLLSWDIRT